MKNIQILKPYNSLLYPYIDCYLFPKFEYDSMLHTQGGVLEVLPSPQTSIILFFSEPSFYFEYEELKRYDEFILTGYYKKPKKIFRTSSLDQMIIKFSPIGIQSLLDFQISEIMDSYLSIEEVFKDDFYKLKSNLQKANSYKERILTFERFMISKLSLTKSIDERVNKLISYIYENKGCHGIKQISQDLGIGERTIQRIIQKYVGINYKSFSKLIRFNEARKLLTRFDLKEYTSQLAYKLNYFDQAHFIHDFKSFSNLTPSQFISKQKRNKLFDIPNRIICK
ncbi:MAG: AraC family transcriptional regulator [Acidimicrobiia bacterium]|nr:AraC family transcriptional regulator [Acidimicrobiia bacterium]